VSLPLLPLRYELASPQDLAAVVAVHTASFPGFFLSSLGPRFLRELYAGIVSDPESFLIVARDGADVVGFAGGTMNSAGLYSRLIKRRLISFGWAAAPAVLRNPMVAARVLRALVKPKEARADSDKGSLLMSIAVAPGRVGRGVGAGLVSAFADEVRLRGGRSVWLTTDAVGNDRVNAFYRHYGFSARRTFTTPEGRAMVEYGLTLPAAN
jgi:ribosomal protein S18 acetylase RimI-like enzyme